MKIMTILLTWVFGVACGLSIASWLIASERIGDAIVFLYTTNGFAVVVFFVLVYFLSRHLWNGKSHR